MKWIEPHPAQDRESLPAGGTYSWQVSALDSHGQVICSAGAFTFTKPTTLHETPLPPSLPVSPGSVSFTLVEGPQNPARFTPLNADVRRRFAAEHGFDPAALFDANSPRHYTRDPAGWARFVDFRITQST